jgi:predicted ATPase
VREIAEPLIKELQNTGRQELPWLDRLGFQNIIFPFLRDNHESAPNDKQVFFDRGFPDELAFFMQDKIIIPNNYIEACRTYQYEKVFLFPAWEEIYQKTAERPWSF